MERKSNLFIDSLYKTGSKVKILIVNNPIFDALNLKKNQKETEGDAEIDFD